MPFLKRHCLRITSTLVSLIVSSTVMAADVRIAVAANFTDTTRELIQAFADTTGLEASASYGSTGKLYAQIENGAPFDVFLAADARRPTLLEESGQGIAGTRFTYARGKLALWSPASGVFTNPEAWLKSGEYGKLAIANPKTAPYGQAAQEVLTHLSLWASLQPHLVRGDSIAQTFQFAATQNTAAGFVALSQVRAWTGKGGTLWQIPQRLYSPIDQQAILLAFGKDNGAAHQWLAFLKSETATKIIQHYGYDTDH